MAITATARAISRSSLPSSRSAFRTATRTAFQCAGPSFRQQWQRRGYADSASPPPKSDRSKAIYWLLGVGAVGSAGAYYFYNQNAQQTQRKADSEPKVFTPTFEDYQKVYNAIAERIQEHDEYEDGSYGPVVLRLAWHASGTYDKDTNTGGSNGATMRFAPEGDHGANAGLVAARDFVEPIKQQFPWITYSDLWTLSGVCAVQEMLGPIVPWRPGRSDRDISYCTPDGRLPDGAKGSDHLRAIFGRMGWNDQEIVALSGAHALGRCHTDRSGYSGPWTFSPTVVTNDYFKLLLEENWDWKNWDGPKQYQDKSTKSLMMLPTDMALVQDKGFRPWVEQYATDNDLFFKDFRNVLMRLFELGVPFKSEEKDRMEFKPLVEA